MRIAVIGAGIVGIATAQALADDGHEVVVFERHGSVGTESSFAHAGVLAPGPAAPWSALGAASPRLATLFARESGFRIAGWPSWTTLRWGLRWQRASAVGVPTARRSALLALARDSLVRTRALARRFGLDYERASGVLVLLRSEREVALARPALKAMAESGLDFHLVDAAAARRIEPGLNEATALKAAIHLPDAEVGNCRQFAQGLKGALIEHGVALHFHHEVLRIDAPEGGVRLTVAERPADVESTLPAPRDAPQREHRCDAVVVCAANGAPALMAPLRAALPLLPVHGYSVTLPVRHFEAHPDIGPRAGLMDPRFKVAISRLGDRVRIAGGAELGGAPGRMDEKALAMLYRVLDDWFPGATRQAQAQTWKGARPMLPDDAPAIGATRIPGVWLNTGHGSTGWALACGSAALLAELIGGRAPAIDAACFSPTRW